MRKTNLLVLISFLFIVVFSCDKKGKKQEETILRGEATILVDETLLPIIDDQKQVFENQYNATITLVAKSESEIVQILSKNKQQLAVLSRELTENEAEIFKIKKITPRITPLATDAIAFISFKSNKDTLIDLEKVIAFVQGKDQSNFKGLVFDNPTQVQFVTLKNWQKLMICQNKKYFLFKPTMK